VFPPLLLIALGLSTLQTEQESRVAAVKARLDALMGPIAGSLDPFTWAERRMKRIAGRLVRRSLSPIGSGKSIVLRAAESGIETYPFDAAGALAAPPGTPLRARFVMQKLWTQLVSPLTPARSLEDRRLLKTFCAALGSDFRITDLRRREGVVQTFRVRRQDGCILWMRRSPASSEDRSGCLLVLWKSPDQAALMRFAARSGRKQARRSLQVLARLPESGWRMVAGPRLERMPRELAALRREGGGATRLVDDRLWMRSATGDVTILASLAVSDADIGRMRRGVGYGGLFAALFGFFLVRQAMETAALRLKLALVFLLAAALPIAGLGYLGFRMLRDRRDTRMTNVWNTGREILMRIDREFDQEILRHGIEFRRIRDDHRWSSDLAGANASATELVRDGRLGRLELRDRFGTVMGGASNPYLLEGMERIFASFCCVCMERALPPGRISLEKQTIDPMARLVFDSTEMGFPYIISHPDMVHLFRIGMRSFLWYWDVYRDPGHPFAFINIAQDTRDAIRRYLARRFQSREALGDVAWRLAACEPSRELWLPDVASGIPSLGRLTARVRLMGQAWSGRLTSDDGAWLVTALPGERISGFTLFALFPEAELAREGAAGRDLLLLAMGIILLVAFLTGGILADTFLVPVGELSMGLAALRKRRFDITLASDQKDELGDLMALFNEMAGRLRQMDMARCVQKALMPSRMPGLPGWEFDLFHQTASELGGDYGDLVRLHDGSLLFVIGDVTGHGAGSALLMVMVKTAVFRFAESGVEPEELMHRLNGLIFRLMKRRKLMTCLIGRLEPETALLRIVNAGHPYPLRCSPDGTVSELTSVGFPLGAGDRRLRLHPVEVRLEPGETILLYTDGLVEGLDASGQMFGYERIFSCARAGAGQPAALFRDGLIGAFRCHHPDPRLEDDLTMIVIRRHG